MTAGATTYHQQISYCGKQRCRKCREGVGHGPYWYAYRTENGRTTRTYIGKNLPPEAQTTVDGAEEYTPAQQSGELVLRVYTLLGKFRVERRSERVWQEVDDAAWKRQHVRSLFVRLLISPGRMLGREQLMDALWPELDFEMATSRLDRTVHSLRQILEPHLSRLADSHLLRTERESLILADQSHIWVDADAFEQLLAKAHATSDPAEREKFIEEGGALYGDILLREEGDADWVTARRESLHRSWLGSLLELADLRIARSAFASVIEPLDRLLVLDSTNEAAVQRLIISLTHLDRRAEAMRAYQRFATELQRRFKIPPLEETRSLYEATQQGIVEITSVLPLRSQVTQMDETSERINRPAPAHIGRSHQGPLIGRESELATLQRLLEASEQHVRVQAPGHKRTVAPTPDVHWQQCVMLVGEAGIGKTRLAEELARVAQRRGWVVAWSRVYAQESSVPYRQWTEVLRNAMSRGLWQRQDLKHSGRTLHPLSMLLPELQPLLPSDAALPPPLSPGDEQRRLWEATLELLTMISERTPLVIVLDDLHWADASSCEMLAFLARRLHRRPIMIMGTYRDTELPAQHPLRTLFADLQREQVSLSMQIQPLTSEQIASLVSHLPQPVVQHIQTRAAGNPFFAEELARGLEASPTDNGYGILAPPPTGTEPGDAAQQPLPDTIAAVLNLRMSRLSSACQRLLGNAAVLGGSFDFNVLLQMESSAGGASEDTVLDLLEEALKEGVLTEEGTGTRITYHFWHPLLVSHLYDRLSAARRANLHRRAAAILQRTNHGREEEIADTITHHLVEGGSDPMQIAHYAELAGDRANTLSAYPEAERYYRIAVSHLEEAQKPTTSETSAEERQRLAYLLERLAECTEIQGNFEEARGFYERTLEERGHQQSFASQDVSQYEAQLRAIIWCSIGWTWYYTSNTAQAQQCCERGEQILREANIETGPAWANIRYLESYIWWQKGDYDKAEKVANEALTLFERALEHQQKSEGNPTRLTRASRSVTGDPVDLGRIQALLGTLLAATGRLKGALNHLNVALTLYEQHDRQREIAHVCCNMGYANLKKADYIEAQALFRRSLSLAESLGDTPLVAVVFSNLGELAARSGNLVEAEKWFRQSIKLAEQINDQIYVSEWNSSLAAILQDQGNLSEASSCVCQALLIGRAMHNVPCIGLALVALGNLHIIQATNIEDDKIFSKVKHSRNNIHSRFLMRAKVALERALTLEGLEAENRVQGRVALAQIFSLLGDLNTSRQHAFSALEDAQQHELTWVLACTQRLIANILVAQGQYEQGIQYFEQAIHTFRTHDMRLEYARSLYSYGDFLLRHKGAEKKSQQQVLGYLREASQIFKECNARHDLEMAEHLLAAHSSKVR